MLFKKTKPEMPGAWTLPPELVHGIPRQVRWSAAGHALLVLIVALVAGGVAVGMVLYLTGERERSRLAALDRDGVRTEATVVRTGVTRGENKRKFAVYRYATGSVLYEDRVTLRKRDAKVAPGSLIPVRYLPSQPARSWMVGYEPKGPPVWLAFLAPVLMWTGAALIGLALVCQRRMLAEGRPAQARVASSKKFSTGESHGYKVEFEFQTMSGAVKRVKTDTTRKLTEGASVTILYDRDNPGKVSVYPLALVRTP